MSRSKRRLSTPPAWLGHRSHEVASVHDHGRLEPVPAGRSPRHDPDGGASHAGRPVAAVALDVAAGDHGYGHEHDAEPVPDHVHQVGDRWHVTLGLPVAASERSRPVRVVDGVGPPPPTRRRRRRSTSTVLREPPPSPDARPYRGRSTLLRRASTCTLPSRGRCAPLARPRPLVRGGGRARDDKRRAGARSVVLARNGPPWARLQPPPQDEPTRSRGPLTV